MLLNYCYLYPNRVEAYSFLASDWSKERFNMVYSRDLKIYRGVDNRIDFQIRNGDQKKLNVSGQSIVFVLVSRDNSNTCFIIIFNH